MAHVVKFMYQGIVYVSRLKKKLRRGQVIIMPLFYPLKSKDTIFFILFILI